VPAHALDIGIEKWQGREAYLVAQLG